MFGFLCTLNLVALGDKPTVRRLLGAANQERRRTENPDSTLAKGFGLPVGTRCEKATHTWTASSWSNSTGTLAMTGSEAKDGLTYVVTLKNDADADGSKWDDCTASSVGNCVGCDSWEKSTTDTSALVIDPPDWTDGHQSWNLWANFGSALGDTLVLNDVEVYWCYTPPHIYLETSTTTELKKTVVGLMGFLAQGSWETGAWESCDEVNHTGWSTAACSQKPTTGDGGSVDLYQDEDNSAHSCALDSSMKIQGEAPPTKVALSCGPDDNPNCCWWGRGSIQTTGPGNYGELQHDIINHSDHLEGVDICAKPETICTNDELKFVAGIYFWVTQVQGDACYESTLESYVDGFTDPSNSFANSCRDWAYGIGGKVNMGNWNEGAHGEDCEYRKSHDDPNIDCTTDPDGRVERFLALMEKVEKALNDYTEPADNPTTCTGNNAVDTIFDTVNIKSLTGFDETTSQYKFTGFCEAVKEFVPHW